jgi:metal-responsive CopG/Arc/MetJ family transcriptional regulator
MPNIKTAISIEKPIFDQMDVLAKNLKISRSHLFSMAAREFIERYKNMELLRSLNDVYKDLPDSEPIVSEMHSKHYQLVKDQW